MPGSYLIRFRSQGSYKRAIVAFQEVAQTRFVFTQRRMVVTDEHLEALKRARVPYELISRPRRPK